jgi:hypothetical protein
MSRWPFAVLLALAAGCGGEAQDPLLGDWQVQLHELDSTGCDAGLAVDEPLMIRFQVSDVLGQRVFELVDCESQLDCEPSAGIDGRLYTEVIPLGRRAESFAAFGDSTRCQVGARRSDAIIDDAGHLRVETRRYEERDVSGVVCEPATAKRLLASLTCREHEQLVGFRPDSP